MSDIAKQVREVIRRVQGIMFTSENFRNRAIVDAEHKIAAAYREEQPTAAPNDGRDFVNPPEPWPEPKAESDSDKVREFVESVARVCTVEYGAAQQLEMLKREAQQLLPPETDARTAFVNAIETTIRRKGVPLQHGIGIRLSVIGLEYAARDLAELFDRYKSERVG